MFSELYQDALSTFNVCKVLINKTFRSHLYGKSELALGLNLFAHALKESVYERNNPCFTVEV